MQKKTASVKREKWLFSIIFLVLSSAFLLWMVLGDVSWAKTNRSQFLIYIGTYTGQQSESKGIYAFRMDIATGTLTSPRIGG